MELHTIRGGSMEALEAREYNIGIGISLGNKWFSHENIIESVRWALPYSREFVIVYIADTIHAINLEIRNRISKERALRLATRYGKELLHKVQLQIRNKFTEEEQPRIVFATWADITSEDYRLKVAYLYDMYEHNEEFQAAIKNIVRGWVSKESRVFTEEEIHAFGTYILEELPEVMGRVPIQGRVCEAYTYPFDGVLTQFVEKLQKGEVFPKIREDILDTEPKIFLEVR